MRVFEGSEGPCYFWPKTAVQATLCSTHCCDVGTGLVYAIWLDVSISCLPRDALGSQHRSTDHHLIWGNELLVDSSLHVQEIDALDIAPDLPCFLWLQWGWILPLGWLQLCLSFHPPVMTWDMKFQLFSDVLLSSLNQVVMLSKEDIFDSGCLMFFHENSLACGLLTGMVIILVVLLHFFHIVSHFAGWRLAKMLGVFKWCWAT